MATSDAPKGETPRDTPAGGKAPKPKRGFKIDLDRDTIKTAIGVAKKVFGGRKKKDRDLSSPR